MSSDAAPDVSALAINVTIPVPDKPELAALAAAAARTAGSLWTGHRGLS